MNASHRWSSSARRSRTRIETCTTQGLGTALRAYSTTELRGDSTTEGVR